MEETKPAGKSKKGLIIGAVVVLIIVGGAAAYFLTKDDSQDNSTASSETSQSAQPTANTFAPASTAGEPFVATLNSNIGGKQTKGIMSSDGQGNVSYAYTIEGKQTTLTYTKDAYYICTEGAGCFKYNVSGENNSGFDPSEYQYDSSKISDLKSNSAYKGQQACPAGGGTCDVWSVSMGTVNSTMYVNTDSKRIIKVTSSNGSTTSDITYEYKEATVTIPQNAVTLPSGQ